MELQQIHELGNGGLLAGIGRTVSAVFSAATKSSGYLIKKLGETVSNLFEGVATGSSKIVKTTANGVATLVKSTGEAVEETEEGLSHIISRIFGGLVPMVNSIIIIEIIVYLWFKQVRIQRIEATGNH